MKVPKPNYITKFKNRINYSADTIQELMSMAYQHDVIIFKYNGDLWKLQREDLNPDDVTPVPTPIHPVELITEGQE